MFVHVHVYRTDIICLSKFMFQNRHKMSVYISRTDTMMSVHAHASRTDTICLSKFPEQIIDVCSC